MEIKNPRISFVMPAYNAAPFISEAIESVIGQTFKDWELIITDDGSTDETPMIIKEYANRDPRIRVLTMPAPSGSAYQPRKLAIQNAKAELIAPLDADDYVGHSYIQNLLDLFEKTESDIVYPTMYYLYSKHSELFTPKNKELINNTMKGSHMVKYTLLRWQIGANGGLINKKLYLKAFGFNPDNLSWMNADELLTRQLLFLSRRVTISPENYYYRKYPESITKKKSFKHFDILLTNIAVLDFIKTNFGENSKEFILAQRQNLYGILHAVNIYDKKNWSRDERKEINRRIAEAKNKINYKLLKDNESIKYLLLSKLSVDSTKIYFKMAKSLKKYFKILKPLISVPKKHIKNATILTNKYIAAFLLNKGKYPKNRYYHRFYNLNYSDKDIDVKDIVEGAICIYNGKMKHGGITDRLRGILTNYRESKKRGFPFYISWTCPCKLEDYLEPATFDWRIDKDKVIYNKNAAFPFINEDEPDHISSLRFRLGFKQRKPQIHVYSNSDIARGEYRELFHELFKPAPILRENIKKHKEVLGDNYEAYTFRFLQLLGDFHDCNPTTLTENEAVALMEKCWRELEKLINRPDAPEKIFVTSDSSRFLKYIKDKDSRLYSVPGDIKHIDFTTEDLTDVWLKTFTDQALLMDAKSVTLMKTDKMYKSGFPRFAAEVGGTKFIYHEF